MEPVQPKEHGRDVELDVLGRPVLVTRFDRREPRRHVGFHLVPRGVVRGVAVAAARPVEGLLELPRVLPTDALDELHDLLVTPVTVRYALGRAHEHPRNATLLLKHLLPPALADAHALKVVAQQFLLASVHDAYRAVLVHGALLLLEMFRRRV